MAMKYSRGDIIVVKGKFNEPDYYLNEIRGKKVVIESISFTDDEDGYIEYYSFFNDDDSSSGGWIAKEEDVVGTGEKLDIGSDFSGTSLTIEVAEDGASKITNIKKNHE